MIVQTITQKIGEAMKAHDEIRLSTLRMLSSEFNYEKINKQHELTDEEELAVVRREAKKRRESVEAFNKAGASDRAERENQELAILMEYLPPDLTDEETEKLVDNAISEVKASSLAEMGKVIGLVKSNNPNVNGAKVAELVKNKLSQ